MAVQAMPYTNCCLLLLLCIAVLNESNAKTTPKFPAILVFGDSTVDPGNNNYILTPFKGDHSPYGLDFPGGVPTGRFSDGKLVPDMLASIIGLKETVPPFLKPQLSERDILTGVSFASAGSGYDDLTTSASGVIPMSKQPGYFNNYIERLEGIVGEKEAQRILNKALVCISAGSNDFIFNYYDLPTRAIQFTIDQYDDFLQNKMQNFIKEIYRLGCRKMLVSGLPPMGCLPVQMTLKSPILRTCGYKENVEAQSYNYKLQKMLQHLETELPGSRILYLDIYNPLMDMINNPKKYGFVESTRGCCGSGLLEVGPLCTPLHTVCANPSQFVFYDSIHPTESTYRIVCKNIEELLLPEFENV